MKQTKRLMLIGKYTKIKIVELFNTNQKNTKLLI